LLFFLSRFTFLYSPSLAPQSFSRMSQNKRDPGESVTLVVKKTVCNREDLIDDMREPWGWEDSDLHGASRPPEMQYLRKWTTRAKNIMKYAFDKLGLDAGRHNDDYKRLLAATEWDYISHYLEGIKKSSGHGQLYELPSQLVRLLFALETSVLLPVNLLSSLSSETLLTNSQVLNAILHLW